VVPAAGAAMDLHARLSGRKGSDGDSSAFQRVGRGDVPLPVCPIATARIAGGT